MTAMFKILLNVIKRRTANGEELGDILKDYPKLSNDEIAIINVNIIKQ